MNLRPVKVKKDTKEMTMSVNIDSPVRIIERIKYEKHKQGYPFCNWETLKITSKWLFWTVFLVETLINSLIEFDKFINRNHQFNDLEELKNYELSYLELNNFF